MAKIEKKKGSKKISFAELSDAELDKMYNEFKKEIQEIRFSLTTGSYPNNSRISLLKKDLARILTIKASKQKSAGKV